MSGDPEQEYFADGMVEDIITGLSRINWLFVIARNSSFAYKGKSPDIRQVGRELGVRYVLEGSVRKAGNRVRITGQLIEAETGAHLWADKFDGALEDVFDLQDKITDAVVGIIEPSLRASRDRARAAQAAREPRRLRSLSSRATSFPFGHARRRQDRHGSSRRGSQARSQLRASPCANGMGLEMRVVRGGFNEADAVEALRHARAALTARRRRCDRACHRELGPLASRP